MPAGERDDERLGVGWTNELLADLYLYRCSLCGLARLEAGPLFRAARHHGCTKVAAGRLELGLWRSVDKPLERTVLLRFLTRQMISGGPRWRRRS